MTLAYSWREFTVFSLFGFVFEGTVFKYKSPGDHIRRGHLTDGFLRYGFEGLIFCYIRRCLYMQFRNFTEFSCFYIFWMYNVRS